MKTTSHSSKSSAKKKAARHAARGRVLSKKSKKPIRSASRKTPKPLSQDVLLRNKNLPLGIETEVNDRIPTHVSEESEDLPPDSETEGLPIRTLPRHVHVGDDDENTLDADYSQLGAGDVPDPGNAGGKYFSFKTRDEEIG